MTRDYGLAVISGTTHGIGRVCARQLAESGHAVVMLCRDVGAADKVRSEILARIPAADVRIVHCDLASIPSVRECARRVREECGAIDLLVNNAGMASLRHRLSPDGYELDFATNHLGPFLLTGLLLDRVAVRGRIVNVASVAHYRGIMDLDQVADPAAPFNARAAYARSKLANVLHTFALARRLAGTQITVNCCHPGIVATHLLPTWLRWVQRLQHRVIFDAARGARSVLYLAQSPDVAQISGRYFDEHQLIQAASPQANDVALQERLWMNSVRWTGLPDTGLAES